MTNGPEPLLDGLGIRCFVFGSGGEGGTTRCVHNDCPSAAHLLRSADAPWHANAPDDDEEYVRSSGKVAAPMAQADFMLARGLFSLLGAGPDLLTRPAIDYSPEAEAELLQAAMARQPGGLPLLVANPDEVRPDGKDSPMPGQLARRYRELGATDIRLVGKPYSLIYERCSAALQQAGLPADARIAAVGDSLHHDVLGASKANVDSVFVYHGLSAEACITRHYKACRRRRQPHPSPSASRRCSTSLPRRRGGADRRTPWQALWREVSTIAPKRVCGHVTRCPFRSGLQHWPLRLAAGAARSGSRLGRWMKTVQLHGHMGAGAGLTSRSVSGCGALYLRLDRGYRSRSRANAR